MTAGMHRPQSIYALDRLGVIDEIQPELLGNETTWTGRRDVSVCFVRPMRGQVRYRLYQV
jgi:hypothetical protein